MRVMFMGSTDKTARVLQIQNFSVHDGDGIRSVIFFAGCPLNCKWCANPEGKTASYKVAYYSKTCIDCKACAKICRFDNRRELCVLCGRCAEACPNGSRKSMVFDMTEDEIIKAIEPQMGYFRASSGGVTFSGGEPTMQPEIFKSLARRLYDMGVDLALETCGYFDFDEMSETLELFNTIFFDIKTMNEPAHIENTGVGNRKILDNLALAVGLPSEIIIRTPIILGFNASCEDIGAICEFVRNTVPGASIELLPYHKYGEVKYEALGIELPPAEFQVPDKYLMKELVQVVNHRITTSSGGLKDCPYKGRNTSSA